MSHSKITKVKVLSFLSGYTTYTSFFSLFLFVFAKHTLNGGEKTPFVLTNL